MGQIVIINVIMNLILALSMLSQGPQHPLDYGISAGVFLFAVLGAYVGVKLVMKETKAAQRQAKKKVRHA